MKTYGFLGILVAAVVLPLAGCDNVVDEVPDAGNDQKVVVKFTGGWGEGPARTTWEETNTGFTVKWKGKKDYSSDCDTVGIYAYEPGTTPSKMKACYYPTTSNTSSPLEYKSGGQVTDLEAGKTYDFYSYFPYYKLAGVEKIFNYSFKDQLQSAPDNSDHLPTYDLMFAECEGIIIQDTGPTVVNFTYRHLLTCLQLQIRNEGQKKPVRINKLMLSGVGILPSKFQTNKGEVEAFTDSKGNQINLKISNTEDLVQGDTQYFWVMVYPVEGNPTVGLSVWIEGQTGSGSYAQKELKFPTLDPGANYIIKLKLNDKTSSGLMLEYDNQ